MLGARSDAHASVTGAHDPSELYQKFKFDCAAAASGNSDPRFHLDCAAIMMPSSFRSLQHSLQLKVRRMQEDNGYCNVVLTPSRESLVDKQPAQRRSICLTLTAA